MFFEGNLHTGIAVAIRDSKVVTCFVRDDGEESSIWETEFLKDDRVKPLLESRAVLLRMQAGSQEAGFLSAFCPIEKSPTILAIYNGQVKAYLIFGISKNDFCTQLKAVLEAVPEPRIAPEPRVTPETTNSREPVATPQSRGTSGLRATPDPGPAEVYPTLPVSPPEPRATTRATSALPIPHPPSVTPPTTEQTPVPAQSSGVQEMLAERRARLEAQKKTQDAAEKQARMEKAKARRETEDAAENAEASKKPEKAQNLQYKQQLKKNKIEAQQERERIMKQIEYDKAERKAREEERKKAASGVLDDLPKAPKLEIPQARPLRSTSHKAPIQSAECAIQVRLLDGSTVRSRFTANETLRESVRPWVDRSRSDGDTPYTFKQILAPLPNRTISISEEEESFQSLGLTPSCTLVMVAVHGYTSAYGTDDRGFISKGISTGYNLVTSGVGLVTGTLGSILSFGAPAAPPTTELQHEESVSRESRTQNMLPHASTPGPSGTIRTLRDHRPERDDRQFYNGNQLNFEPNRDDNDKKD